ncbi:hypothetical protein VP01_10003g1, partial [Puccinia sorghi]
MAKIKKKNKPAAPPASTSASQPQPSPSPALANQPSTQALTSGKQKEKGKEKPEPTPHCFVDSTLPVDVSTPVSAISAGRGPASSKLGTLMHDMVYQLFFWVMNEKNKVQDGSHYKLAESLSPELMVAPRLGSFHPLLKASPRLVQVGYPDCFWNNKV